jgi:glucose/arabinose dehydrogenase
VGGDGRFDGVKPVALLVAPLLLLTSCSDDPVGDPDGLGSLSPAPQPSTRTGEPSTTIEPSGPRVVATVTTGLAAPWGVTFLPDGSALVGERDTARVVSIAPSGRVREVGRLSLAAPQGEAGLLGLAASPSYAEDGLVYAYVTTSTDNRVVRMEYDGRRLGPPQDVLTGIPTGFVHDGGRLLFDPDGNLFVSTGEIGERERAQDADDLAGKILHITPEGEPAPDNPVPGSAVWTMGHRNVQGLAFDDSGRLWATEFGQDTWDELNLIERGRNYGWPVHEGRADDKEYRNPHVQWRTSEASPSGLAYVDGALWAASLRGERLWRIPVTADGVGDPEDYFVGDYGRIRTVNVTPDGLLWVTTSNRDGRGTPAPEDDRILLVQP